MVIGILVIGKLAGLVDGAGNGNALRAELGNVDGDLGVFDVAS